MHFLLFFDHMVVMYARSSSGIVCAFDALRGSGEVLGLRVVVLSFFQLFVYV